jgi:hypothetical protein
MHARCDLQRLCLQRPHGRRQRCICNCHAASAGRRVCAGQAGPGEWGGGVGVWAGGLVHQARVNAAACCCKVGCTFTRWLHNRELTPVVLACMQRADCCSSVVRSFRATQTACRSAPVLLSNTQKSHMLHLTAGTILRHVRFIGIGHEHSAHSWALEGPSWGALADTCSLPCCMPGPCRTCTASSTPTAQTL